MFSHAVHRGADEVCVALAGQPEFGDHARLLEVLIRALHDRPAVLRVDLGSVEFIDCAAVGTLIEARTVATGRGSRFVVSNPQGVVLRILHLLDLLAHFTGTLVPARSETD